MIALPARDEAAISLALDSLEQKLASWMSAMTELQTFLRARGVRAMFTETPALTTSGLLVKGRESAAAAPPAPKPQAADHAPETPSAGQSDEDGEALLATLDTDTANWIRVKRRLTGNRRSVRELLDEFRAQRGAPKGNVAGSEKKRTRR